MINLYNLLNSIGFKIEPVEKESKKSLRENIMNNKTIRGAFSKLSDDEKKSVVDSLNSTQKLFNDIFGFKTMREWTVDDLDGSYVNVTTSGNQEKEDKKEENKCECEGKCTCGADAKKKDAPVQGYGTLADALRSEIDRGTKDDELAEAICENVVEKLNDKKNHPYKLHPAVGDVPAMATVDVRLLQEGDDAASVIQNSHICSLVRNTLIKKVGCRDVFVVNPSPNILNNTTIRIELVL